MISSTNSTCIVPAQGLFAIALRWQLLFWRLALSSEPWPWVSRHAFNRHPTLHLRHTNDRTCRIHHVGIHLPARRQSLWLTVILKQPIRFVNKWWTKCKSKLQHPGWCFCSSWLRNTYPSHANCTCTDDTQLVQNYAVNNPWFEDSPFEWWKWPSSLDNCTCLTCGNHHHNRALKKKKLQGLQLPAAWAISCFSIPQVRLVGHGRPQFVAMCYEYCSLGFQLNEIWKSSSTSTSTSF